MLDILCKKHKLIDELQSLSKKRNPVNRCTAVNAKIQRCAFIQKKAACFPILEQRIVQNLSNMSTAVLPNYTVGMSLSQQFHYSFTSRQVMSNVGQLFSFKSQFIIHVKKQFVGNFIITPYLCIP